MLLFTQKGKPVGGSVGVRWSQQGILYLMFWSSVDQRFMGILSRRTVSKSPFNLTLILKMRPHLSHLSVRHIG